MIDLSVIVPVFNEENKISETLSALPLGSWEELIVVDGGSFDETAERASRYTDRIIYAPKGRARQMNAGAREARGDILFFLHADCVPPPGGFDYIREALWDPGVSAGAFDLRIDHPAAIYRLIEWGANLRSRLSRIPYGDQGLFLRRGDFEEMGGFKEMPLMEDIEIGRRLKRRGRICFLPECMTTSPRRWLKQGPLKTTLRDWRLALSYTLLDTPAEELARDYLDIR